MQAGSGINEGSVNIKSSAKIQARLFVHLFIYVFV